MVDPRSPETAYAAAMGHLWQPGGERGLFKTTDGGKSWSRVLAAAAPDDAVTGCGDVALDPKNPDTLYAALYARQRKPWRFDYGPGATGGRDAGGIFKSSDGGATWRRLANGLPPRTGRIGLAVYAKDPRIVYAVVQSDEGGTSGIDDAKSKAGGVFRSEDGGESWTRVNRLNPRAFYFSQIRIDPQDDRRIYVLGFMLHVSDDGGKTFREDLFKNVHADCHALVIVPPAPALVADAERAAAEARAKAEPGAAPPAPLFSRHLILGTDGGAYQSFDAGASWAHLDRVAAAQYYRI
ncbi:MAG: glycoside hydrolase, partial [Acidobacteria bacterium]|nr:glycoside hydrolase [Acidobacteriota bacterium]